MIDADIDHPVILLGRGGSGTRLLSVIAAELGVFLGNQINETGDSVEWVEPIYRLAVEATTFDVCPETAAGLAWRDHLRARAAAILAAGSSDTQRWGWKLPETMLVLPHVLAAFPEASVVHIVRHPFASSARRSHMTSRLDNPVGQAVLAAAYRAHDLDLSRMGDDPVYLHNALTWDFQVGHVLGALRSAPFSVSVMQLTYESCCTHVHRAVHDVARFLGLDVPATIQVPDIEPVRAAAQFDLDETARERIWSICGETALALGYAFDPPAAQPAD